MIVHIVLKDDISYFLKDIFECELNWYPKAPKLDIPYHLPEDVERKFSAGEKMYFQTKHDESMIEFAGIAYRAAFEL